MVDKLTPYQGTRRVFGKFQCPQCHRGWMSANSWANKGQKCQRCDIMVYPYSQTQLEKSSEDADKIDLTKHHPMHLCQRCQELGRYCGSKGSFRSNKPPVVTDLLPLTITSFKNNKVTKKHCLLVLYKPTQ
ncbi:hypothetical protein ABK040_012033 [Willaertia magna]